MTVKELIAQLEKFDGNLPVIYNADIIENGLMFTINHIYETKSYFYNQPENEAYYYSEQPCIKLQ